LITAPKLTPDNFLIPDAYVMDLDRNSLDSSIFPLAHHAGELIVTPNSYQKKYAPSPSLPSPYPEDRFITDIRVNSELNLRDITYNPAPDTYNPPQERGVGECKRYVGNRHELESLISNTKALITQVGAKREETQYPGSDIEIITLGTGSAIPNKYRNGSIPHTLLI
jgi:hypothetical protein